MQSNVGSKKTHKNPQIDLDNKLNTRTYTPVCNPECKSWPGETWLHRSTNYAFIASNCLHSKLFSLVAQPRNLGPTDYVNACKWCGCAQLPCCHAQQVCIGATCLLSVCFQVSSYNYLFLNAVELFSWSTNMCRFHRYMLYRSSCQCVQVKLGFDQTSYRHCKCITLKIFGLIERVLLSLSSTSVKGQSLSALPPPPPLSHWNSSIREGTTPYAFPNLVIVITTWTVTYRQKLLLVTDHEYSCVCLS